MSRFIGGDGEYSIHYLTTVAVVTMVVAALAWLGQNRSLAMAAAVLGLYALHLLSIRFILEGQRRQRAALESQWQLLQKLLGQSAPPAEAEELKVQVPAAAEAAAAPDPRVAAASGEKPVPVLTLHRPGTELEVVAADAVETSEADVASADAAEAVAPESPPSVNGDDAARDEAASRGKDSAGPSARRTPADVPIPRHFALGTVALVRNLLTPAEVARVLLEQRKRPDHKFGSLAVEMGLLTESEREELLLAQQEGLFTDAEMREARQRLKQFRESTARVLTGLE